MVHEIEGAFYLLTSDFVAIACLFFVHNLTLTGHSVIVKLFVIKLFLAAYRGLAAASADSDRVADCI